MKKNLYTFLLSAMALVVFSSTTWAQKTQRGQLELTYMAATDKLETEGWKWEPNTQTLTIDGLNITGTPMMPGTGMLILPDGNVTIILEGDGNIENTMPGGYAIVGASANLTIEGSGELLVRTIQLGGGTGMVLYSLAIEEGVTVIIAGETSAITWFEYTVPAGYTYWTHTAATDPGGNGVVSDGSVTLNNTSKYIKIVAPASVSIGGVDGNITWTLAGGVLTISGTGDMPDYALTDTPWKDYASKITSIVIQDGVTDISNSAFMSFGNLTTVSIPNSVISIGGEAFYYCTQLTGVILPDNLECLGTQAFMGCSALTAINLPADLSLETASLAMTGLTEITIHSGITFGKSVFAMCESLTKVTIADEVTEIGEKAFYGCTALVEVIVERATPPGLGEDVFGGDIDLGTVTLTVPVGSIDTYKGTAVWQDFNVKEALSSTPDFTLYFNSADGKFHKGSLDGDVVTDAFSGSFSFEGTTLTLNDFEFTTTAATALLFSEEITLNLVGNNSITSTFEGSSNSNGIRVNSSLTINGSGSLVATGGNPNPINNFTTNGIGVNGGLLVIDGATVKAYGGNNNAGKSVGINVGGDLTVSGGAKVHGEAGTGATDNTSGINLGNNSIISVVGTGSELTAVADDNAVIVWTEPADVVAVGSTSKNAGTDEAVYVAQWGVYHIGNTGQNAHYLKLTPGETETVTIKSSTPENNETGVSVDATVTVTFSENITSTTDKLNAITIKDSENNPVTGVSASIKDDVLTIAHDDFGSHTVYTVTIPVQTFNEYEDAISWSFTSVQYIFTGKTGEEDAITWEFNSKTGMMTLTGTGAMPNYGTDNQPWVDFKDGITSVIIEEGITSIGSHAFFNYKSLILVDISKGITSIGDETFTDCHKLESVSISEGVTSIGRSAFKYCYKLSSITIPASVTSIKDYAFQDCSGLKEITVLAETIPVVGNADTFFNVPKSIPLYVPADKVDAYKNAYVWKEFTNILPISKDEPSSYHNITLDVAPGIEMYNLSTGNHQVAEGEHLHLQFLPEDRSLTADDILFLIDGVETEFKVLGENNYYSYTLNPVEADHTILIALKEYTVTLPEVEGITYNVGAGTHQVTYGDKFSFAITLDDTIDPEKVHVYANDIEILPDALRTVTLTYTIDKVITPVIIVIEGAGEGTVGNIQMNDAIRLEIVNCQLSIVNSAPTAVDVAVYAVTGQSVVQLRALRGSKTISLQPGIYLVKAADKVYKISVN